MQVTRFEDYKILFQENTLSAFNVKYILSTPPGITGNFGYVTWIAVLQSRVNTRSRDNLAKVHYRVNQFISHRREAR